MGSFARMRYADLPIRLKLLVPLMIPILIWGVFGSYFLARGLSSQGHARTTAHLSQAMTGVREAFADAVARLLETTRSASGTEGVAEAILNRDERALRHLLLPVAANAGHSRMWVVDRDGVVLLSIDLTGADPALRRGGRLRTGPVRRAARGVEDGQGDKHVGLTARGVMVSGPARDARGVPVGAVAVSDRLAGLTRSMAHRHGVAVTVYKAGGALLRSSAPVAMPFRGTRSALRTSVMSGGRRFEALYTPLEARLEPLGFVAVSVPSPAIFAGMGPTAILIIALVALAIIIGALLSFWTTRGITRPLDSLLGATKGLEQGDLSRRAGADSRDELGVLATAFNRMAEQLQASHAELQREVAERTELNEALLRANEAKSAFLATMSHELRTPLNAVIGFADFLADPGFETTGPEETRQLAAKILASGQHLLALINDILDLTGIEAGRLQTDPRPTDLGEVIAEVATVMKRLADAKRLSLEFEGNTGLPDVMADPARLRQILYNLLANAIKFTGTGGRVALTCETRADWVTVSIADSGAGMTEAELERVFEPFERADAAHKVEGIGLGLPLARHLVEIQGGRIWCSSVPGQGSTFWFTVPRVRALDHPKTRTAATEEEMSA